MYPAGSTQNALRPDERRSNARLTTSSIVLVHLGPDNGGIVINLSVDGVACQAAMRLAIKPNANLTVRLRGSGLNLEAAGELVWIGASQKEVGVRFKDLSAKQRQEISSWIDRERKPRAAASLLEPSPVKPMPPMPGIASKNQTTAHPLSAALGMSQENREDPLASLSSDEDDAGLSALLDSERGVSPAAPRLEIVPPFRETQDSENSLDTGTEKIDSFDMRSAILGHSGDVHASLAPAEVPPALEGPAHQGLPAAEDKNDLPAVAPQTIVPAALAAPHAADGQPVVSAPADSKINDSKAETAKPAEVIPAPAPQITPAPALVAKGRVAENWIPPALLTAWRSGTSRNRFLLAAAAVIFLGFFAFILALALAHAPASSGNSAGGSSRPEVSSQPATQPPAVNLAVPGAPSDAAPASANVQSQPMPAVTPPPAPHRRAQPQPSPLSSFAKSLGFGSDDSNATPQIDDEQLRVQVWTSQSNGYYYCTDDPYYKNVTPGDFMSQGEALQSGYRPILGQFCD